MRLLVIALLSLMAVSTHAQTAAEAHASISDYKGPQTCVTCHTTQAADMFGAVHYRWTGPTPNATNITGEAGKADRGFNTYCGTVITSRRIACWSCHVGYGKVPSSEMSIAQLNNIDCMMCHSELYERKPAALPPPGDLNEDRIVNFIDLLIFSSHYLAADVNAANQRNGADINESTVVDLIDFAILAANWLNIGIIETISFIDYLGTTRFWMLPAEVNGNFSYVPDTAKMIVSPTQAAQMVHKPTRKTCLRCHAYAAGTNCGKRGDISSGSEDPPVDIDIHMSSTGQNINCQGCHQFQAHHVLGRGLDIRENDRPERLTCTEAPCHQHSVSPHDSTTLNQHTSHVACQSCHIPQYATLFSTEIRRDWREAHWAQGLFNGQGGYKPLEVRAGGDVAPLIPTYTWYDGTSRVYVVGEVAQLNANGQYSFGTPNGDVNSPLAQIFPMKEHLSNSARHTATGTIIPHSTSTFFFTGDFNRAVADGMTQYGLTGPWTLVDVHTWQTLNHGVRPTNMALQCGSCHDVYAGTPVMDLPGKLGYELKAPLSTTCSQGPNRCHELKPNPGFVSVHNKHVQDKKFDCSWCHKFSRPERNLTKI